MTETETTDMEKQKQVIDLVLQARYNLVTAEEMRRSTSSDATAALNARNVRAREYNATLETFQKLFSKAAV